ncbi:MAG: type 2 lanthipeptide synthetase LanM [Bacteroidota bacterium]|nr:type 2 lanthipeptide synthetase LanM [Bacteroidota bacterium]
MQKLANAGSPPFIAREQPAQLLKFRGFSIFTNWYTSTEEDKILAQEARLKEFIREMQPYKDTPAGTEINGINQSFLTIESSTVEERNYETVARQLQTLHTRLDNISTGIARLGIAYDSTHAADVAGLVEGGYEGPKTTRLLAMIMETNSLLPAPFRTPANKIVIKDSVLGNLSTVAFRETDVQPGHLEFAAKRVLMLRKNFIKMQERITADWAQITNVLNLNGRLRFIHLTGSDYHNDGQSVSLIETDTGDKAVYKPRSLSPDQHLESGNNSSFNDLNQGPFNAGLNTTNFLGKTDAARNNEEYGYMQFLTKANVLSHVEAQNYYLKMGKLVVSTKLLGVTDLHNENILTGTNGEPYIIDAETSFLPDIMLSQAWGSTGINDTLTTFTKNGHLTVNNFYTPAELTEWQLLNPGTPDAGFITQKRTESIANGGPYRADFIAGIDHVLNFVNANQPAVINSLKQRVQQVHNVRIVPLDTTEFAGALNSYTTTPNRENVLNVITSDIRISLTGKGYVPLGAFNISVKAGLKTDFGNTDLPLFHYEPSLNRIFYKGVAVAQHGTPINQAITTNVTQISQAVSGDVLAALGI